MSIKTWSVLRSVSSLLRLSPRLLLWHLLVLLLALLRLLTLSKLRTSSRPSSLFEPTRCTLSLSGSPLSMRLPYWPYVCSLSHFLLFLILFSTRVLGLHTSSLSTPMMLLVRRSSASRNCIALINLLSHPTTSPTPTGASPTFAKELWRVVRLRAFLIPCVSTCWFISYFRLILFYPASCSSCSQV